MPAASTPRRCSEEDAAESKPLTSSNSQGAPAEGSALQAAQAGAQPSRRCSPGQPPADRTLGVHMLGVPAGDGGD